MESAKEWRSSWRTRLSYLARCKESGRCRSAGMPPSAPVRKREGIYRWRGHAKNKQSSRWHRSGSLADSRLIMSMTAALSQRYSMSAPNPPQHACLHTIAANTIGRSSFTAIACPLIGRSSQVAYSHTVPQKAPHPSFPRDLSAQRHVAALRPPCG